MCLRNIDDLFSALGMGNFNLFFLLIAPCFILYGFASLFAVLYG